jgi:lysophospholipase L1-like esterase
MKLRESIIESSSNLRGECSIKLFAKPARISADWLPRMLGIFFAAVMTAVAMPDGSLNDTNIQYFGRWNFSNATNYVSDWGGAYFKVNFSGTTVRVKVGRKSNYFAKIDDGAWINFSGVEGVLTLTPNPLAKGIHSLSVAQGKDYDYRFEFQGLILDPGAITSHAFVSQSLIEFIGDSITCGYMDAQANVASYGWVCAENLNCEHTQIAYPGINLTSGYKNTGMDVQYAKEKSFAYKSSQDWNFSVYTPQVVVINLGQNDNANRVPDNVFQSHYKRFLGDVREKFPGAEIFALRTFLGFKAAPILAAVNAQRQSGDDGVHYVDTTHWLEKTDYVDGVHPTAAGNIKAAKLLQPLLAPYVGDVIGKVTVGYQGWFSARGDGSPVNNWGHDNLEMWPDVGEYTNTYPFPTAVLPNGQPARMFSSYDDQVVQTHFKWMAESGIDCAALQRFANELHPGSVIKAQRDGMAIKVMKAAEATGRKFYIMYDTSGWGLRGLRADWNDTIVNTLHLTASPAYARQNGKPVVCIYGMGYVHWPASPEAALDLINWFKARGCYVIGSVPGQWRSGNGDSRSDFMDVYSDFDMLSAWAVGRRMNDGYISWVKGDQEFCAAHNIAYQPCLYPGTSFHNSNDSRKNLVPRRHGDFLWSQFATLRTFNIKTVYIAMFDEMNEATSIFKCAEDPSVMPTNKWFLPLDADGVHVSSDFYLRLVKNGASMVKDLTPYQATLATPFVMPNATTTMAR